MSGQVDVIKIHRRYACIKPSIELLKIMFKNPTQLGKSAAHMSYAVFCRQGNTVE